VPRRRIGKRATKREETTPARMESQVTRTFVRMLAKRRLRVAMRAEERVDTEGFSEESMQERIRASGVTDMRASWYTVRGA
jgi:hypothetical protein